jgi:hypothetical protein
MLESTVTAVFGAVGAQSAEDGSRCADALIQLQRLASRVSLSIPPAQTLLTHQVFFVAGMELPWRLVETTRSGARQKKLMLCFESLDSIQRSVEERRAWQRADEEFVAKHMSTPGGFPGITADWVPSKDFDLVFGPQRKAMRQEMCITAPDCIVTLRA